MRLTQLVLALFIVSNCIGQQCNSYQTRRSCSNQKQCLWQEQNTEGCDQIDCDSVNILDSDTCKQLEFYGICTFHAAQPGFCRVKQSACQVQSSSDSTCNSSINCDFVPATAEICANVGKGFGCDKKKAENDCTSNPQCGWAASYCYTNDSCRKQSYSNCDSIGCQVLVDTCSLKKNASQICSALKTEVDCISQGCVFQNSVCTAPSKCFVNNNSCTDICEISSGSCADKQNYCSSLATDVSCNKTVCQWVTDSPSCEDKEGYCNLETCNSQGPYCQISNPKSAYCTPKTQTNQCLNLSEDECTNSSNSNFCEYVPSSDWSCSNPLSSCSAFVNQDFCSDQYPCTWEKIKKCVDNPWSTRTHSNILRSLFIFSIYLFFF